MAQHSKPRVVNGKVLAFLPLSKVYRTPYLHVVLVLPPIIHGQLASHPTSRSRHSPYYPHH
jgi:hypothetical protein